jgi:hypothetical protein
MKYQVTITLTDEKGGEVTRLYHFVEDLKTDLSDEVRNMQDTLINSQRPL